MATNDVNVGLNVQDNASRPIKNVEKAIDDLGSNGQQSLSNLSVAFSTMEKISIGAFAAVGAKITEIGFQIVDLAKTMVTDGVRAAMEQEKANNALNIALINTGKYSKDAAEDISEFASEIQRTTTIEDDAVINTAALIQQMGNLSKDGLKQATQAAIDLSAALGIDLNTAATMVGKAANGEVGSFKKLGIEIKKGADDAETFSNAMNLLNQRFGGSAQGQVKTFAGAIANLRNVFGDLQEEIGGIITTNPAMIKLFSEVKNILLIVTKAVSDNKDALSALVTGGVLLAIDSMVVFIKTIGFLQSTFSELKKMILGVEHTIVSLAGALSNDLTEVIEKQYKDEEKVQTERNALYDSIAQKAEEVRDRIAAASSEATQAQLTNEQLYAEQSKANAIVRAQEDAEFRAENQALIEEERTAAIEKEITQATEKRDLLRQIDSERYAEEILRLDSFIQQKQALLEQDSIFVLSRKNAEIQELRNAEQRYAEDQRKIRESSKKSEEKLERDRVFYKQKILTDLSSLQFAENKKIAAVGKAAAIADTTIKTYQSATAAFTALAGIPVVGPALGAAAAAAAIAAGIANVAKIKGTPLATGIDSVPGVGTKDNFPAILAPGERVVPRETNKDLTAFLSGNSAIADLLSSIDSKLMKLQNQVIVNVGDKEILNVVRSSLDKGRVFA